MMSAGGGSGLARDRSPQTVASKLAPTSVDIAPLHQPTEFCLAPICRVDDRLVPSPQAAYPCPPPPAHSPPNLPIREPGQSVSAAYRRDGTLRYEAEGYEIVGRNGRYFNNRPLYCRLNTDGAVLTGDRPLVRLIAKPFLHGALALHGPRVPRPDGHADRREDGDPRCPLLSLGVVPEFCTGNIANVGSPRARGGGTQAAPASGLPTGFTLSASPTASTSHSGG